MESVAYAAEPLPARPKTSGGRIGRVFGYPGSLSGYKGVDSQGAVIGRLQRGVQQNAERASTLFNGVGARIADKLAMEGRAANILKEVQKERRVLESQLSAKVQEMKLYLQKTSADEENEGADISKADCADVSKKMEEGGTAGSGEGTQGLLGMLMRPVSFASTTTEALKLDALLPGMSLKKSPESESQKVHFQSPSSQFDLAAPASILPDDIEKLLGEGGEGSSATAGVPPETQGQADIAAGEVHSANDPTEVSAEVAHLEALEEEEKRGEEEHPASPEVAGAVAAEVSQEQQLIVAPEESTKAEAGDHTAALLEEELQKLRDENKALLSQVQELSAKVPETHTEGVLLAQAGVPEEDKSGSEGEEASQKEGRSGAEAVPGRVGEFPQDVIQGKVAALEEEIKKGFSLAGTPEVAELAAQLASLRAEKASMAELLKKVTAAASTQLADTCEQHKEEIQEYEEEVKKLRQDRDKLVDKLKKSSVVSASAAATCLEVAGAKREMAVKQEKLKRELVEAVGQLRSLKEANEMLEEQVKTLQDEKEELQKRLDSEGKDLVDIVQDMPTISSLEHQIQALKQEKNAAVTRLRKEVASASVQVNYLLAEKAALEERLGKELAVQEQLWQQQLQALKCAF